MNQANSIRQERQRHADEIIAKLRTHLKEVLQKYPVEAAYLYGSVARGQPLPTSDVDIALLLSDCPLPYQRLELELKVQADLEDACDLPKVDVRTLNDAPLAVQGDIVQNGILFYTANKDRRVAFEVLTRKKYFDYQPKLERLQQALLQHIRREGLVGDKRQNDRDHHK